MIDRCTRCHRRLSGLFSTQVGMGPVCMRKSHQSILDNASKSQADLFEGELKTAEFSNRVQSLLARVDALVARKQSDV